jgi:hypothetical protein
MPNRFVELAAQSDELTKKEIDAELARITSFTEDKLSSMLPKKTDKENFAELMAIVNSSTNRNNKVAQVRQNINQFGEVIVKLLELV